MKYLIKVTQEDIDKGVRENCDKCPIALSIKRVLPSSNIIKVYHNEIWINFKKYKTLSIVSKFINNFDHKITVKPFKFELEIT